jgi:phage FluMu protein Com
MTSASNIIQFLCPECNEFFEAEVFVEVDCPRCGILLETDYFDDEYAGVIGVCSTA